MIPNSDRSKHQVAAYRAEGQAILLVALALVLLVGMAGLALDGANAFNQRRNTNNAADMAAMAGARALVQQQEQNGQGGPVNDAVQTYLDAHTEGGTFDAPTVTYVDRRGQEIGTVTDAADVPSDAQGVVVSVRYTFGTYFMGLFGWGELTVTASGMAIYGPIGSAIGGDLIPLALDQSAAETFYLGNEGDQYSIDLFDENLLLLNTYDVYLGQIKQISFKPGGSNLNSPGNSCSSGSPQDNLSYWWCNGSQYELYIGELVDGKSGTVDTGLRGEIQWRIDNRPIALVPVVVESGSQYDIRGFLAIRLEDLTSDGIEASYVDFFIAPGAIVGQGNGLDTKAYAINLVR
jgi:Flp pilus assembly protein TadG